MLVLQPGVEMDWERSEQMDNGNKEGSDTDIFRFDYSTLPTFGMTLFVGRTESGKTSGMYETMFRQRHEYDIVLIMCDSVEDCMKYAKVCPTAFVYEGWNEKAVQELYDIQQDNIRNGVHTSALIVCDDLGFDSKTLTGKLFKRIACNGRHARIRTLLAVQDPKQIKPDIRGQIKQVFVAPEKSPQNRERVFECFNPCFANYKEFDRAMLRCTKDRRQMVMYMHQGSGDRLRDNVFWTLPPPAFVRKFRIPSEQRKSGVWNFSNEWGKRAPPTAPKPISQGVLRQGNRPSQNPPVQLTSSAALASVRSIIHARQQTQRQTQKMNGRNARPCGR